MYQSASLRAYFTMDKTRWGWGAWQGEPDKQQWTDGTTGFPCLVVRHPRKGNWCGYVGVSEKHPAYGLAFSDGQEGRILEPQELPTTQDVINSIVVHGGLSFAGNCSKNADERTGICHVSEPGQPDTVWWFGFDCGWMTDKLPAYEARNPDDREPGAEYRTLPFVTEECRKLALQLEKLAPAVVTTVEEELDIIVLSLLKAFEDPELKDLSRALRL